MPDKGGFKVTNPNAPFIKLSKMLDEHFTIPNNKLGDMKWLVDNVHLCIKSGIDNPEKNSILKKVKDLLEVLTFAKKGKKDE